MATRTKICAQMTAQRGGPGGARGTGACQDAGVTNQRFDLVVATAPS